MVYQLCKCVCYLVSIYFSRTVQAASSIIISGHCSAISSAKEVTLGSIYNLANLGRANVRAFHEKSKRIHTELTFINP